MATRFSGTTVLKRLNSKYYQLDSFLSFENSELKITIKPGFVTDGASIPRIFWSLIGCPFSGKYVGSAIIHDGLFKSHVLSEKDTNKLFLEMLKDNKVHLVKRTLMSIAVKIYSKIYFNKAPRLLIEYNSRFVKLEKLEDKGNAFANF